MRYLVESFAVGALVRGKAIAQFLGPVVIGEGGLGVSWVEIQPVQGRFTVMLHVVVDVGGEHFVDLWEFPSAEDLDEEDFGRELAVVEGGLAALEAAEGLTAAVRGRWVNLGVVQDEYLDYVRCGRQPGS